MFKINQKSAISFNSYPELNYLSARYTQLSLSHIVSYSHHYFISDFLPIFLLINFQLPFLSPPHFPPQLSLSHIFSYSHHYFISDFLPIFLLINFQLPFSSPPHFPPPLHPPLHPNYHRFYQSDSLILRNVPLKLPFFLIINFLSIFIIQVMNYVQFVFFITFQSDISLRKKIILIFISLVIFYNLISLHLISRISKSITPPHQFPQFFNLDHLMRLLFLSSFLNIH